MHATPQQHMGLVKNAVSRSAEALCAGLESDGLYVGEGFLDAAAVVAMVNEAKTLDPTLVPSQSTRWDGRETVAYDKEGVRSTQIQGGPSFAAYGFLGGRGSCDAGDRCVHDVSEVARCGGPEDARWALTVWLCAEDESVVEATPDGVLRVHFPDAV